jgi:malate dehydrogenase (oxaloacetate-decarboxylating)
MNNKNKSQTPDNDYSEKSIEAHKKYGGKLAITSKMPLETQEDLSIAYTPGVAGPCLRIAENVNLAYEYTFKKNSVAVVSDGSAVLGLGNIGPEASLPVMEGKAVLFKKFADIDAIPIVLSSQDTDSIINAVKCIAPTFGGINLEDISAPRCFEIERRLKEELNIPVMHDDQHGTAVVALAGLMNAMKVTGKKFEDLRIVISGAGAAGIAIINLLWKMNVHDIIMCDSSGIIHKGRSNLTETKQEVADITNKSGLTGSLEAAVKDADVFIGVSAPGILSKEMVRSMKNDPVIFAMANPTPEIMPGEAKEAGARVVATGRSDFPNQVNNVLVFPGLFRGLLDACATELTDEIYLAAAKAIANRIDDPAEDEIIPDAFDSSVTSAVAKAVYELSIKAKKNHETAL